MIDIFAFKVIALVMTWLTSLGNDYVFIFVDFLHFVKSNVFMDPFGNKSSDFHRPSLILTLYR